MIGIEKILMKLIIGNIIIQQYPNLFHQPSISIPFPCLYNSCCVVGAIRLYRPPFVGVNKYSCPVMSTPVYSENKDG